MRRQSARVLTLITLVAPWATVVAQTPERDQPKQTERASNGIVEMAAEPIADHERLGHPNPQARYPWTGLIEVTIRNLSRKVVRLAGGGGPWANYTIEIFDSSGKAVPMTERGKREREDARHPERRTFMSSSVIELEHLGEFKEKIDLSEYFQVRPGQPYTVKLTRSSGLPTEDEDGQPLKQVAVTRAFDVPAYGVQK